MNDFINFVEYPEKYTSKKFFDNCNKELDKLNAINLKKCEFKKEQLKFENKGYQRLYDNSPGLPTIKTILDNPKRYYIIPGGIRIMGARYPDYIINKNDIIYLSNVLDRCGILKIPMSDMKLAIERCVELTQGKLKTFLFNDFKKTRWTQFDVITNSFRNMCMGIDSYIEYKNKFVPTSLHMLLYFTGDCREHRLLLLYLMRIYLHHNDTNNRYSVESVYANIGHGELVSGKMKFFDHKDEHTFPILINKSKQDIMVMDALNHATKILKNPPMDQMLYKNIVVVDTKYYSSGYFLVNSRLKYTNTKNKPCLFELIDWWAKTPCQYLDSKMIANKSYLYGIPFKPVNIKYVFDKSFNILITKRLFNSKLCTPKLKTIKTYREKCDINKKKH